MSVKSITPNYGLIKYDRGHSVVDTDLATNMDIIDSALAGATPFQCHNATGLDIAIRSICYISGDQAGTPEITKAQADVSGTSQGMLVITSVDIANGAAGGCIISGQLTGFTGLTPGAIEYLSNDTAGAMEETATTTTGEIMRIMGYALSSSVLYFNPDKTYIELS